MKERILFVLAFFFLFVSGYSFVESYTLEDSPFEEANQFETYFLKRNFLSISGLYHWGDVLNGKLRLGFRGFFGELGYTQLFSIPIYTYSGDIEDFASSGVYSLGLGLVWNSEWYSLGSKLKLSYSYLLEVTSVRLSIDFFGKLNFDNFSYGFSLKNILSLGGSLIWTSRDTYLSIIPVVFDNSFVYSFNKNLRFLGGIKFVLYQEFDLPLAYESVKYNFLYPQIDVRVGATYSFATNMNITFINTFKYGNYLNLGIFYESVVGKDIEFVVKISYSYVNFIEGGIEVFFKNIGFLNF